MKFITLPITLISILQTTTLAAGNNIRHRRQQEAQEVAPPMTPQPDALSTPASSFTAIADITESLCMTLDGTLAVKGGNVIMADCDGRLSQKWIIEETTSDYTPRGVFLVKSAMNEGLCLDAERSGSTITNLHVWECKDRDNRRFNQEFDLEFFQETGKLLNKSNYCLDWDHSNSVVGEDKNCGGQCCPEHIPEFVFLAL